MTRRTAWAIAIQTDPVLYGRAMAKLYRRRK
jgi:hypothetical protein